MANIFFTSDLHFSHRNIAQFCPAFRPADFAQLNEVMIAYWNETVSSEDTVYNLGDVSFSRDFKQIERVLCRLNGTHHLIYGNHDEQIMQHAGRWLNTPKHDGLPMLASVQHYLKLTLDEIKQTLVLFHYPMQEWDGCHKGWYHLHGHIHERIAPVKGRILNVGWDLHGRFLTARDVDGLLRDLPAVSYFTEKSAAFPIADVAENEKALRRRLRDNQ